LLKPRYAILVDGGFLTKKLYERLQKPATVDDVVSECDRLTRVPHVQDHELLRIYYYDAEPASQTVQRPISGTDHPLSGSCWSRWARTSCRS
jgi:hypothetical protein